MNVLDHRLITCLQTPTILRTWTTWQKLSFYHTNPWGRSKTKFVFPSYFYREAADIFWSSSQSRYLLLQHHVCLNPRPPLCFFLLQAVTLVKTLKRWLLLLDTSLLDFCGFRPSNCLNISYFHEPTLKHTCCRHGSTWESYKWANALHACTKLHLSSTFSIDAIITYNMI